MLPLHNYWYSSSQRQMLRIAFYRNNIQCESITQAKWGQKKWQLSFASEFKVSHLWEKSIYVANNCNIYYHDVIPSFSASFSFLESRVYIYFSLLLIFVTVCVCVCVHRKSYWQMLQVKVWTVEKKNICFELFCDSSCK